MTDIIKASLIELEGKHSILLHVDEANKLLDAIRLQLEVSPMEGVTYVGIRLDLSKVIP